MSDHDWERFSSDDIRKILISSARFDDAELIAAGRAELKRREELHTTRRVRVKVFADGRVAVLMYEFVDHRIVGKFCLVDDGSWRRLAEGEAATPLSDVVSQSSDETTLPDGTPWEWGS